MTMESFWGEESKDEHPTQVSSNEASVNKWISIWCESNRFYATGNYHVTPKDDHPELGHTLYPAEHKTKHLS